MDGEFGAKLWSYRAAAGWIPAAAARLTALIGGHDPLAGLFAAVRRAHAAWVDDMAEPELAAVGSGDWAAA